MEKKQLSRYVGQQVEIVYIDKPNVITQRFIEIHSIKNNFLCAYCFTKKRLRVFSLQNILAISLAKKCSV
ncbi:hypothetical protein [Paenibacillus agricola]|uniref:WYL domain-containing protein n=1 Tax=Paenibacillus agricola TaxID=2716264 RepID=A0ABX0JII7_9BACL|nr:hypothetical protein [Paenibacillus agricola]NHN34797.1 hypothetical protein [Paenibacillus agricola]